MLSKSRVWLLCSTVAAFVPILIPAIHFTGIYHQWHQHRRPVFQDRCGCSCWDKLFKAGYLNRDGRYKHVYFNVNKNSLVMWGCTVVAVILAYEVAKKFAILLYAGRARPLMCILLSSMVYSHYYAWWMLFNYFNEDYYQQFWHQLLFTTTELVSSACVVQLVDADKPIRPRFILLVVRYFSISAFHILASLWDQFVVNVILGEGQRHQVLRDLGFMAGDLLHLILPWVQLKKAGRATGAGPLRLVNKKDVKCAAGGVALLSIISAYL